MNSTTHHEAPSTVPDLLDALVSPSTIAITGPFEAQEFRSWGYGGQLVGPHERADVALITVPAPDVLPQLETCVAAGTMRAVVLAAGFEGATGAPFRGQLERFLAQHPGFRLIGPNCAGVLTARNGVVLGTAAHLFREPPRGGSACLVFQSGGIGIGVARALAARGAGFAHFASTGDEVDVGALELAIAFLGTPDCTVVALFLEGLTDAQLLPELSETIDRTGKPVLAVRCGSSRQARAAAFGHTGRVIGDADLSRAALEYAGVHVLSSIEELCDVTTVLSALPERPDHRVRVGIVVGAGGAGVLAADELARAPGLRLADLSPLPNPHDTPSLGDPGVFPEAVRAVAADDRCDVVVAVTTTLAHDYDALAAASYAGLCPIVFTHMAPGDEFSRQQGELLSTSGVPNVTSVVHAIRALGLWAPSIPADQATESSVGERLGLVASSERIGAYARRWLAEARVVTSPEEASAFVTMGAPVVVKAEGTHVEHRTEVGAIRTGLLTDVEVVDAYEAVAAACDDAVVVQQSAPAGIEVIVSVLRDQELGPVALIGLGGVLVELGSMTPLPRDRVARKGALLASPAGRLLQGYRGAPAADVDGLLELIDDLLIVLHEDEGVAAIECNPVIVHPRNSPRAATIVDLSTYLTPISAGEELSQC